MNNKSTKLLLNWYELQGNSLVGEEELRGMTMKEVLRLFDAPFWNGMYQCWAVEAGHIGELQKHITHQLDIANYAYFVEAIAIHH